MDIDKPQIVSPKNNDKAPNVCTLNVIRYFGQKSCVFRKIVIFRNCEI